MADRDCTHIEEWRPVVGFEGKYEVSSLGRVRSLSTYHGRTPGSFLKPRLDRAGYWRFTLSKNCKTYNRSGHRLVSTTFLGPRPNGYHVNHINFVRTDNRLVNLEYVTPTENVRHSQRAGRLMPPKGYQPNAYTPDAIAKRRGESAGRAKLTEKEVREIRKLQGQLSAVKVAQLYGLGKTSVRHIWSRVNWKWLGD